MGVFHVGIGSIFNFVILGEESEKDRSRQFSYYVQNESSWEQEIVELTEKYILRVSTTSYDYIHVIFFWPFCFSEFNIALLFCFMNLHNLILFIISFCTQDHQLFLELLRTAFCYYFALVHHPHLVTSRQVRNLMCYQHYCFPFSD